jgi:hypothetical protein
METLCGYRIFRELGGGERSQVLLARDPGDRLVVLRVLPAETDEAAVSRLLGVMTAAEHPNLLPLADVATSTDGRVVLVLPRVAGGSLGEALSRRDSPGPLDRVRILRSAIGAVQALHGAGWAHGRVDPTSILLATDGTPVLAGFGDAVPLDDESRTRDLVQTAALVCAVLRLEPTAAGLLLRLEDEAPGLDALDWALADLQRQAEPAADSAESTLWPAARLDGLVGSDPHDFRAVPGHERADSRSSLRPEGGPGSQADAVEAKAYGPVGWRDRIADLEGLAPLLRALHMAAGSVRRPVWVAAGGVAAALVVAMVLIPQGEKSASADLAEAVQVDTSSTATADPATDASAPAGTAAEPSAAEMPDAAAMSDDPLEAVRTLLVARQVCFETGNPDCFDSVDQAGSTALDDDVAAMADLPAGAPVPPPVPLGDAPFVQRTGDSAIIAGEQVSILLVRGDGGWRIRDIFDR